MADSELLRNGALRLRPVEPEDALAMWEMESDPTQWIQNGMMAPFSLRNLREYALQYRADPFAEGQLRLMLVDKNVAEPVGIVDLYDISASNRTAWVGIYIRPAFRGNGLGKKALQMLEDYCRRLLNLRILAAKIASENAASQRLFAKAGYTECGRLRDWLVSADRSQDILIFQKHLITHHYNLKNSCLNI
jgi:diamine N-acetyltransferase